MKPKRVEECGCCETGVSTTPKPITNRPGLPEISYRVGTFAGFRQAMIEAIAGSPGLADLTARESNDYGIALMEMWAYLADILTFYQERIANEAFLRTARHRDTLIRLAAVLDYKANPGVAAQAFLAFFVEEGKTVNIPVGLRVQSVPGQDEKPQKFETIEPFSADAALNQQSIFPKPSDCGPLNAESDGGPLKKGGDSLSPGDKLVLFNGKNVTPLVEEKQVESLEERNNRRQLTWSPPVLEDKTYCRRFLRKFRLFGYDAPETYLTWQIGETGELNWKPENTDFDIKEEVVKLDSIYDDLEVGTPILVVGSNSVLLTSVSAVGIVNDTNGGMNAAVTQITMADELLEDIDDLRSVTVYELVEEEIEFYHNRLEDTILKDSECVYVPVTNLDLPKGRTIFLDDKELKPQKVTVTEVKPILPEGDEDNEYLAITFEPGLERDLDTQTAVFYGNVVKATQGETIKEEILGSGDASAEFQEFTLKKSPVTFVTDPNAPKGARNTLEIRVEGVLRQEVDSFYHQGSTEPVYVTRIDDSSEMSVRFGDGKTGARLPTGQDNVTALYRQGIGSRGNIGANSIKTLLDRPVGLKGVFNPMPPKGGTDPESIENIRTNAPNTVRTFERAISLRDYEDLAREYTGIAKAKAVKKVKGEHEFIQLTIAGENGNEIKKNSEIYKGFVEYLDKHRDINHRLEIVPHHNTPLQLNAIIYCDPLYLEEDVSLRVKTTLLNYFHFENLQLGQPIYLSDIYEEIQGIDGVKAVVIEALDYEEKEDKSKSSNTPPSYLVIDPDKIATLAEDDLKIITTLSEGG